MKFFRRKPKVQKIGLALGGGGARGLAHIQVLETLDELGIRPHRIAGTSIGAVMGSLYASGLTGKEIRDLVHQWQTPKPEKRHGILHRHDLRRWASMLDPSFDRSGLFKGEKIIRFLSDHIKCTTFEALKIPLYVTAADYGDASEVVFKSGDLLSAVRASIAIPGVFTPVERDGSLLLDGGVVNPLPYNLLQDECDLVIAVDVGGTRHADEKHRPAFFDTIIGGFEIMETAIIRARLQCNPPDIYLKPDIRNVGLLEFYKAEQVFRQSEPMKAELRRNLKELMRR
ncbi:MAG: patatin-like phospholipase family protein [Verrucomicrobia bacterium]|nr:patatin-like phospholipase family protein [Verrucomicrobiota bacterium]